MSETIIATELQMEEIYLLNQQEKEASPSYYATIPAPVRYDKELKPMEKLLYGEISSLSNQWGFCIAGNSYFAKLYDVDKMTVSRWINKLKKLGYVDTQEIRNERKQVVQRRIYMKDITVVARQRQLEALAKASLDTPIDKKIDTPLSTEKSIGGIDKKIDTPIDKKVKDNIIYSFNNKIEEKEEVNNARTVTSLDTAFTSIKSLYTDITGKKPTQYALNKLKSVYATYGELLVIKALEESAEANKPLQCMEAILTDWSNNKLTTIEEVNTYIENFKKQKQTKKEANKHESKKTNSKSKEKKPKLQGTGTTIGYDGNWMDDLVNGKLNFDSLDEETNDTTDSTEGLNVTNEVLPTVEPVEQTNTDITTTHEDTKRIAKERNPHLTDTYLDSLSPEKYDFLVSVGMLK